MRYTPSPRRYALTRQLIIAAVLGSALFAASFEASSGQGGQERPRAAGPQAKPQDYVINVGGYKFDPLRGEPQLKEELKAGPRPEQPAYHIVQFTKSLTRAERERLQRSHGLRLNRYIPNLSYLEKVSAQTLAALGREPVFRASVPYHPAFKIDPQIGKRKFVTERRRAASGFFLFVLLFPEADLNAVAQKVARYDAKPLRQFDETKNGGRKRLLVVAANRAQIENIARLEEVEWIEEQGDITVDNATSAAVVQSDTATQTPLYTQGLRGEGQIVGLIDATLDMNHCFFNDPANAVGPAHRKVVGYRQDNPATFAAAANCIAGHGTHTGGTVAGQSGAAGNNGVAVNARLTYGDLSDLAFAGGTRTFLTYLSQARDDGAFVHSNSWSDKSTTNYTIDSQDLDTFTWNNEDQLVVVSSSNNIDTNGDGNNDSPSVVRPPWTSKNGLPVGASAQSPNQTSVNNGGQGLTNDGRRKPEIYAPGGGINSARAGTNCGLQACTGSSMATPAVAAAAALARQYYTEGFYPSGTRQPHNVFTPSGALLKATLLNATRDMTGNDAFGNAAPLNGYPTNLEGWGRLVLDDSLFFAGDPRNLRVWDFRNAEGLLTGESRQHTINVASNAQPLKITLVWMDPPPAAASFANPVINDINLTVTSPGGAQTFVGNDFVGGVTQANSGVAADALNNVEMVLVNTPAQGAWTITVTGATVGQGNPGQGYALVATADLTEPPVPSGNQDTLVVRVNFNDISFTPPLPNLQNKIDDAVSYVSEVSYGKATIAPDYAGPVNLDNGRGFYYHPSRNLLIEMTEEVVAKLIAADPNTFTKGTADPADDIDRLILVTNDEDFTDDWATTGPWPYDLPGGFTRPISVSVQSFDNNLARFAHGLGHQFGLVDLYAHPGVTFSRPSYADLWDNMAKPFRTVHYLTWEKEHAGWMNTPMIQTLYIPRPAAGASYSGTNPIPLFFQESTAANIKAIALGTTNGAATLGAEDVFYYVEAREKVAGSFDNDLPSSGVLIYFVNERIPQGQGPVILLDKTPGTDGLEDAAFQVGDSRTIPGTGITLTVLAGTGGAAFNIQVAYAPPNNDYNVRITKGDTLDGQFYPYFSSDVWVDSPKNGIGNLAGGPPPNDQIENPVVGMQNNLCARVSNDGPGIAFDFDVRFRVSEPFQTVGGEPDFDQLVAMKRIPGLVPAGAPVPASPAGMVSSPAIVCVPWTPVNDGDPHSCLLVDFINLVGVDTNQFDNAAQENLQEVTSVTMSPFHPVSYPYELTNPYDQPALFYFRAEGAPPGWSVVLNPKKAMLNPGQRVAGLATVKPPPDAQVCTSERIQITSWTPRGDTIINVGGAVAKVNLRRNTLLTLDTRVERCRRGDQPNKSPVIGFQPFEQFILAFQPVSLSFAPSAPYAAQTVRRDCDRIVARGCTNPPLPNQLIVVKYVEPDGTPVYHQVMTDGMGCYEDFLVSTKEGEWKVTAEYEGDKCQGPATGGTRHWKCCQPIK